MIPLFKVHIPKTIDKALLEVLHSGYIGQGEKVEEFEQKLIPWVDNENLLTVNSGTSAIHLALHLAGVGQGDEVITTPMTCSATITPIYHTGARIRWADINPKTGNIDPESIRKLVTDKTKAIVCVHWGGYPCDMSEIHKIADKYGTRVIEDAAHAFGAIYKDKRVGSISDYTCFSFQAIKHLTTIDGGLLTCRYKRDYKRAKLLRWYGIDRDGPKKDMRCEVDIAEAGWKYHMNDVCATIGIGQLTDIYGILHQHSLCAIYYDKFFASDNITRCKSLSYKGDDLDSVKYKVCDIASSYWLYTILVDDRDAFQKHMTNAEIQTSQVHSRCDEHSCFSQFAEGSLPGVDEFTKHQISIPVHWGLSHLNRSYIMDKILQFEGEK